MNHTDIHVGDILRIRDWDDMVAEFGVNSYGCVDSFPGFTPSMKYLCGETFTVANISPTSCGGVVRLRSVEKLEAIRQSNIEWFISSVMVEPIEYDTPDESYEPISINELKGFLNSNAVEVNNGR